MHIDKGRLTDNLLLTLNREQSGGNTDTHPSVGERMLTVTVGDYSAYNDATDKAIRYQQGEIATLRLERDSMLHSQGQQLAEAEAQLATLTALDVQASRSLEGLRNSRFAAAAGAKLGSPRSSGTGPKARGVTGAMAALLAPTLEGFGEHAASAAPTETKPPLRAANPPPSGGTLGQDLQKAQGRVSALSGRLGKVFEMAGVEPGSST